VLQNAKKKDKSTAVLTYCDIDLFAPANGTELVIDAVQRHYLKKYGKELLLIKSFVSLQRFTENGKVYELNLAPISKQLEIDECTIGTKDIQGEAGPAPTGAGREVRGEQAGDL
jgi:hypothetical protein